MECYKRYSPGVETPGYIMCTSEQDLMDFME